ncbi:MAG: serine hydrolase [Planctomycetota bacterium]|nr:serine hydrolase [Planctomycetota bacterium]
MPLRILCVVVAFLSCGTGNAQTEVDQAVVGQTAIAPDISQLASVIEKARADWNVPGLCVAIVKDGQVVLAEGFGVRELGKPDVVDSDTVFAIASNTKAFTAAAMAILEEERKIRWDDHVQKYLPWLQLYDPYASVEIRIDDLLCHRSGLGTFSGDLLWWGTPYSPEDVLRRTRHLPAKGRFRATYGYSNLMFLAAGEVIHEASGKPWPEFIQERILNPVGMTRTVTSIRSLESLGNFASPHKPTPDKVTPIPWYNWDTMAAAGGIISSANDMAKWLRVQLNHGKIDDDHRLFSDASSHKMWSLQTIIPLSAAAQKRVGTPHFKAYGLGWSLSEYKGRKTVSHGGGYDGMYSQVLLIPEENLGVVVLTNSMTGISSALATAIVDEFLGGEKTDRLTQGLKSDSTDRAAFYQRIKNATTPRAEGTQPSRDKQANAGTYRCPLYGDATVGLEDDKLVLRLLPNPELVADLTHLHYDTWVIRWRQEFAWFAEGTIQFVPDSNGDFQELRLNVPNDDLWFDELKPVRVQ